MTSSWPRGVAAADHGADRGADDDVRLDAVREQRAEHADMGKAARAAAAERKPDGRARRALRCFGCCFGAAVAVASAAQSLQTTCSSVAAMIPPDGGLQGDRVIMVKGVGALEMREVKRRQLNRRSGRVILNTALDHGVFVDSRSARSASSRRCRAGRS